ncbi:class I SAM-dependent methyltransferase [Fusibacter bizertensis]|nr:class I SAM-dependent methyltransferase [Fusibacter bizertensis]
MKSLNDMTKRGILMSSQKSIYNRPDIYDILFTENMTELLKNHYETVFNNKKITSIHDCSYGTGNLTKVLSKMGYKVSGSDISNEMLEQAHEKNIIEQLDIKLIQSDFRDLTNQIHEQFDCVMSTGNSLAHVNNDDVKTAIDQMSKLIKAGGYIYIDTRNWDRILDTNNRFYYYQPMIKDNERINAMQVWDYNDNGTITFNLLYSFEKENRIFRREEFSELYYPFTKEVLVNYLKEIGFKEIELYSFIHHQVKNYDDMEWYVIIGKK